MKLKLLFLIAMCLCANQCVLHAQDTSVSQAGSSASTHVSASQGNAQTLMVTSTSPGTEKMSGDYTVHANPGALQGGLATSFSNWNCANSNNAGASSFWGSVFIGGAKESLPCNFRANAALAAQLGATAANINLPALAQSELLEAAQAQHLADLVVCQNASRKVLKACIRAGLVAPDGEPNTTSESTWQACHANIEMLVACKHEGLVTSDDQPKPTTH